MHGAQVYADLVPENDQEISLSDMVLYAREHLGLAVACMTAGPNNLAMRPLGVAYNTLKLEAGSYMIVLSIIVEPADSEPYGACASQPAMLPVQSVRSHAWSVSRHCTEERHTLAFLAGFHMPSVPEGVGALVDNDTRVGIRLITESDRESKESARAVFDSLFWTAKSVRITSVWRIACTSAV